MVTLMDKWQHTGFYVYCGPRILPWQKNSMENLARYIMIGRFLKGVQVTPETLAVNIIQEVGTGPDFFLNKENIRKWWQHEQFIPAVADTTSLPEWLTGGKKATIDLAKEKMGPFWSPTRPPSN